MREHTFTIRLITLLGIDAALAIFNSYIPHELTPVRWLIAAVQLVVMAVTMGITMRRVLEDY